MSTVREDSVDEYSLTIRDRWRQVLAFGIGGLFLFCGYTALTPPVYRAEGILLLPSTPTSGLPGGPSPINVLRGLATSREMLEKIGKDVNLSSEKVEDKLDVKAELNRNQLILASQSASKSEALEIVTSMLKWIRPIESKAALTPAARKALALQSVLEERREELAKAESNLSEFSSKSATQTDPLDPSSVTLYQRQLREIELEQGQVEIKLKEAKGRAREQGKNTSLPSDLPATIEPRKKLLESQVAYQIALRKFADQSPELNKAKAEMENALANFQREVQSQIAAANNGLSDEIAQLETDRMMLGIQADFWRGLSVKAPEEAIQLMRLTFEVESLTSTVKILETKASEALQTSEVGQISWSVLMAPTSIPDPINKNYGLNGALGLGLGLFSGVLFATRSNGRRVAR